jgi:hypothetical protein
VSGIEDFCGWVWLLLIISWKQQKSQNASLSGSITNQPQRAALVTQISGML